MTPIPSETETETAADVPAQAPDMSKPPGRARSAQPVLEKLFELYPRLFGAQFLPLKLGVFQELLARHPEHFQRDSLKLALGLHTRSARYLQSVASGQQRHDLDGLAVDAVAPEHICQAVLELFRRRQARVQEDLRPKLRMQLVAAFKASGLTRQDYLAKVQTSDEQTNTLLEQALDEYDHTLAKQDALIRAFDSSGKTLAEFADMYGLDARAVSRVLGRKQGLPEATCDP